MKKIILVIVMVVMFNVAFAGHFVIFKVDDKGNKTKFVDNVYNIEMKSGDTLISYTISGDPNHYYLSTNNIFFYWIPN